MSSGKLFVCSTPIGNLEDVTLRVLRILGEVDVIAAEDTRMTRKLLNKYKIKTSLESYHEHNEIKKSKKLVERLKQGLSLALVSDAGTPGLSDPGYRLIKACIEAEIDMEVLPGPFAAVTALVASGFPADRFVFQGFVPRKQGQRKKVLQDLSQEKGTLIFYESCHRIKRFLEDALEILGERPVVMARELTKKYEEIIRGTMSDVLSVSQERELKGEIVMVIAGASESKEIPAPAIMRTQLKTLMAGGLSKKDAIKKLAVQANIPKRAVYEIAKTIPNASSRDKPS